MKRRLRVLAFGFLAGMCLCAWRAPLGLDAVHVVVANGETRLAVRALGLALVGLAILLAKPLFGATVPAATLLAGATLGLIAHGLGSLSFWQPGSWSGLGVCMASGFLALLWLGRAGAPAEEPEEGREPPRFRWLGEGLAWLIAGGGVAILFEEVATNLRPFGLGLAEDDTVFGAALLACLWVGALAFGRSLDRPGWRVPLIAAGLAFAAAGCLRSYSSLALFADDQSRALRSFLQSAFTFTRFGKTFSWPLGLGTADLGTWKSDAALGMVFWIVPAFGLGAALYAGRRRERLAALLFGAALGLKMLPGLLDRHALELLDGELQTHPGSSVWMRGVTWVVLGASLAALLFVRRTGLAPRLVGAAGIAAGAWLALQAPSQGAWPDTSWLDPHPGTLLVHKSSEGIVTVQGGIEVPWVHVDGARVSPTALEERADNQRIELAFRLLPAELRDRGEARVLFVGQMTEARARTLANLGARKVHRTAPWFQALPAVEEILFEDAYVPAPGERVAPDDALAGIERGEYDLVLVAPAMGPRLPTLPAQFIPAGVEAPRVSFADSLPAHTLAVIWIDAASTAFDVEFPGPVLLSSSGFEHPALGLVLGRPPSGSWPADVPRALEVSGATPLRSAPWLKLLPRHRNHSFRGLTMQRLAGADDPIAKALGGALAKHYAVQRPSSAWESKAAQIEIDPESLPLFREAAMLAPEDAYVRPLFEGVARTLAEKRMPDLVLEYVGPVAEAHAPWPGLERALIQAYIEFDMIEEVVPRIDRLVESEPYDIGLLIQAADWSAKIGDYDAAVAHVEAALAIQPDRRDLEKKRALILHEAGDPRAKALLEAALERDPEDDELLDILFPDRFEGGEEPPEEADAHGHPH